MEQSTESHSPKPLILSVKGVLPQIPASCWLAPNCTVIGDVVMGEECSVWFNAVVRGDVNAIRIGNRVNIQDGAIVHCTYQKSQTHIEDNVSIAHNAIVHGCYIEQEVLVGMGAIIMDGAHIEKNVIVAAGAVVLANARLEAGYIYAGAPAKKNKEVSEEAAEVFLRTANNYVMYKDWIGK